MSALLEASLWDVSRTCRGRVRDMVLLVLEASLWDVSRTCRGRVPDMSALLEESLSRPLRRSGRRHPSPACRAKHGQPAGRVGEARVRSRAAVPSTRGGRVDARGGAAAVRHGSSMLGARAAAAARPPAAAHPISRGPPPLPCPPRTSPSALAAASPPPPSPPASPPPSSLPRPPKHMPSAAAARAVAPTFGIGAGRGSFHGISSTRSVRRASSSPCHGKLVACESNGWPADGQRVRRPARGGRVASSRDVRTRLGSTACTMQRMNE